MKKRKKGAFNGRKRRILVTKLVKIHESGKDSWNWKRFMKLENFHERWRKIKIKEQKIHWKWILLEFQWIQFSTFALSWICSSVMNFFTFMNFLISEKKGEEKKERKEKIQVPLRGWVNPVILVGNKCLIVLCVSILLIISFIDGDPSSAGLRPKVLRALTSALYWWDEDIKQKNKKKIK